MTCPNFGIKQTDYPSLSGADLGLYKGRCPIYLKGAPEVEREGAHGDGVWGGGTIFVFLISKS